MLLSGDHQKVREWRIEQSRARAEQFERAASRYHRHRAAPPSVRRFFSRQMAPYEQRHRQHRAWPAEAGSSVIRPGRSRARALSGGRGKPPTHPGLRGNRDQAPGPGVRETFTVRKQSFGVGVERTFPLHSPKIEKLEIAARGDVRRAKLYYLRGRIGKAEGSPSGAGGSTRGGFGPVRCRRRRAEALDAEGVSTGGGGGGRGRRGGGRGQARGARRRGDRGGRGQGGRGDRRRRSRRGGSRGGGRAGGPGSRAEARRRREEETRRGGGRRGGGDRGEATAEERSRQRPATPARARTLKSRSRRAALAVLSSSSSSSCWPRAGAGRFRRG